MEQQTEYRLYVGSYPEGEHADGIYLLAVDRDRKVCSILATNAETENPSYLLLAGGQLYAANEHAGGAQFSCLTTGEDGSLRLVDTFRAEGAGTCQLAIDPAGERLYGANYESGSVSGCGILPDGTFDKQTASIQHTGRSVNPDRQNAPHVHMVNFAPDSPLLIAVDLGTDTLTSYAVDTGSMLDDDPDATLPVPAGEGPRMVAHHPTLPIAALITELGNHLIVYRREGAGLASWRQLETHSLVFRNYDGETLAAHVLFSPDGRRLYASVRGPNQIVAFSVGESGELERLGTYPSGGSWPRHMDLSPDGSLLAVANERSNVVVVFEIDRESGLVKGEVARCEIANPTCAIWGVSAAS